MRRAVLSLVGISLALGACTEPRSATCRQVCKREAECVEATESKVVFNETECVAACAALENDVADNGARVQRHVDCVGKQSTCEGVLACK